MIKRKKLFTLMIAICLLIVTAGMARYPDQNLAGKLSLWYKQPANSWMTQTLTIGNGPMGAILFGRLIWEGFSLTRSVCGQDIVRLKLVPNRARPVKLFMVKKSGNQTLLLGVYIILIIP